MKKITEKITKFVDDFKVPTSVLILAGVFLAFLVFSNLPAISYKSEIGRGLSIFVKLSPVWLPLILFYAFWRFWVQYVNADFLKSQKYKLLEIRIPREIEKTPQAMETFLKSIYVKPGESTFIDRNWDGKVRPYFSLEIASFEGEIRFFIRVRDAFQRMVEAQLYAQYSNIEIYEANDYTDYIDPNLEGVDLWGSNFVLTKSDPYPIKTYLDHGLDKETEEERKVDPMANLLEHLASIGEGEQIWYQIIFQRYRPKKNFFGKELPDWKDDAKKEIDKLMMRDEETKTPVGGSKTPEGFTLQPMLSEGEKNKIKAIERSLEKPGFDTMIRGLYIAKKDNFYGPTITNTIASITSFGSENLNGFKPDEYMASFDYPWQDFKDKIKTKTKKQILKVYRTRSFVHPPFKEKTFILTSEEIATIYHLPGWIVQPPTLERIPSKKGTAPSGLPI